MSAAHERTIGGFAIYRSNHAKTEIAPETAESLVAALVYDGLCVFEFSCAAEVFGLPRPEFGADWYRFETCAVGRRRVRSQYGLIMESDGGVDRLAQAGTIIVPGWRGADEPVPAAVIDALRLAHARGARLLSICSGAFVLAATGLLDGKRATTHWRYADALRSRYPRIQVDADVLYVDEGQLLTSAGSAAGLDLCLHLLRRDYGPARANQVARRLVIPPHREGGQAQFVESPVDQEEGGSLAPVLDALRAYRPLADRRSGRERRHERAHVPAPLPGGHGHDAGRLDRAGQAGYRARAAGTHGAVHRADRHADGAGHGHDHAASFPPQDGSEPH